MMVFEMVGLRSKDPEVSEVVVALVSIDMMNDVLGSKVEMLSHDLAGQHTTIAPALEAWVCLGCTVAGLRAVAPGPGARAATLDPEWCRAQRTQALDPFASLGRDAGAFEPLEHSLP